MTENISLPLTRFSAQTHLEALEGLVQRYEHEGSPIHYKKAAININDTTSSSCLRYFGDIGLIRVEKQGVYVPSNSVIDFFTKVGQTQEKAVQEIHKQLKEDPVFREVTFHLEEDEANLDELSEKVAGILEINRDDLKKVCRAIEIFAEFEALVIDDDDVVSLPDKGDISDSTGLKDGPESESVDNSLDDAVEISSHSDIDPDELELPPPRGDPESLHQLCVTLKQRGNWTVSGLADEDDSSERTVRRILRYGEDLGFIDRAEGEITLTESGYDLGFEPNLNDNTNQYFLDAVLGYDFYRMFLSQCLNRIDLESENPALTTSDCEHELRTYFGFTDESQETLRRSINTFLRTIESTGFGEYIVGSGGSETRLELEKVEVENLIQVIQPEARETSSDESQQTEEIQSEKEEKPADELEQKTKGPPLRISSFRIQNFRNIRDSGDIRLDVITTFIGKNESGKTSTLEAIASFDHSEFYLQQDICNETAPDYEVESDQSAEIPIVTLRFEITEEVSETFYEEEGLDKEDLPATVEVTKYADGHFENDSGLEISEPSPDIVYYNRYDIISDALYFDEDDKDKNDTFQNLLAVGELTDRNIVDSDPATRHQAIEHAENLIERRLNKAWSQKDVRINLRYEGGENCLHLYIQDDLEEERPFTSPSQRSEGFQWFFSFYINLIAETDTDEDGYKILLLDDPAVHLHPRGKQDWLDSLEEIAKEDQVLYTSHSPYLINKRHPSRIRTVEDSTDGTQINSDIFDADTGTLEPLRNALGVDLSSSPFVSEGQVLVEGPSEYYILSAVGRYFDRLERDFFDWNKVSLMPVRGANDVIGKAGWLESEHLEYVILLDSDDEGQDVQDRISSHHGHIDDNRVLLLSKPSNDTDVVIEDLFPPELYTDAFNEFYQEFTEDFEDDFESLEVEDIGHNQWEIGREEYEGQRIDELLIHELERQDIADELSNDDGDIELKKRQIAEIISDRINNNQVEPDDLEHFNQIFGEIDSKFELN